MKDKHDKTQESEKLTIYEYEQKYSKRENLKGAKLLIKLIAVAIGCFLFFCMFSVCEKMWAIHMYAGIAAICVCAIIYIFFFIIPLIKIAKLSSFSVNVNAKTAHAAQVHNRKVRHELSDKIIEFTSKVEGVGWYDSEIVGRLAIARNSGDEKGINVALNSLYTGCIKKNAKDIIFKTSLKTAMYSAMSQTDKIDAMLVAVLNLQLVKDLLFLYGFRPSDTKLVKIFARVLQNSLIAYGIGGSSIGNTVVQTMGNAVKSIPLLGAVIATVIDSSVQGLTNGVLTALIGRQTIKYLSQEYRLQEVLDGIVIEEDEQEFKELCTELKEELKGSKLQKAS